MPASLPPCPSQRRWRDDLHLSHTIADQVAINALGDIAVETIDVPRVVKPRDVVLKLAAARL